MGHLHRVERPPGTSTRPQQADRPNQEPARVPVREPLPDKLNQRLLPSARPSEGLRTAVELRDDLRPWDNPPRAFLAAQFRVICYGGSTPAAVLEIKARAVRQSGDRRGVGSVTPAAPIVATVVRSGSVIDRSVVIEERSSAVCVPSRETPAMRQRPPPTRSLSGLSSCSSPHVPVIHMLVPAPNN